MATSGYEPTVDGILSTLTHRSEITVLHVDDDPDFADLVSIYLQREGDALEVITETDAEAALERLDTQPIDCIVSDYDMPGMNGLEFLDTVREEHENLPFILFTGKGSEEIASEAISAGVSDYLQKEGGTDQYQILANRIENAVHRRYAIQEVERGFHAIETAREGISFLDEEGEFLYVNPAYADTYGYEREELVGEHWEILYPEEHLEQVYDEILPSVPVEGKWSGETIHRRKDGTRLVINHALSYCKEGTLLCFIEDITEQKQQERTLKRERQRFERFVDAVEDYAIFALDPEGYITSWNKGAERLKGYSQEEIIGEHFSTFYPEEKVEAGLPEELLEAALQDGSVEAEGWRVRQDGSEFWADVVITAVFDENEQHQGFLKVTRDLTEWREYDQNEVEPSTNQVDEDLILKAVNEAPVGLTISGPPEQDVPLLYINEEFTELTNYEEADVIGRNCRFLQGEGTSEEPVRKLREAIDSRERTSVELRNYRKDGTEFWNQVKLAPLRDEDGTVTNYVGFQQDITERKRKAAQLKRQSGQFEHFGSVLSHDLATPLRTVEGHLELAKETGEEEHLTEAQQALERLEDSILDLANVMKEGELVKDTEAVIVPEVAREIWETLDTAAATLSIEAIESIKADEDALKRLLENLFKNALEHAGHEVEVRIGDLSNGFYIEDNGPGVPADQRERIFEAGYSTKEEGSGFGMASVRQLVIAHGWEITVSEGADGGARFEITGIETA